MYFSAGVGLYKVRGREEKRERRKEAVYQIVQPLGFAGAPGVSRRFTMKKLLYASFVLSAVIYLAPPSLFSTESRDARGAEVEARPTVQYHETKARPSRSHQRSARRSEGKNQLAKQANQVNDGAQAEAAKLDSPAGVKNNSEGSEVAVMTAREPRVKP